MAATTYTEMIDRAKAAADMHDGFPNNTTWLYWLNAELRKLWVKIVRGGYPISLSRVVTNSTGASSYLITEPMAIIGIYELVGGDKYYKVPIKPSWAQYRITTSAHPREVYVTPAVATGQVTLNFYPTPPSGSVFHTVVIAKPDKIVSGTPVAGESNSVNLPFGWEERVVLGMAQRALAAEETINPSVDKETLAVTEQIDFQIHDYILRQANTAESMSDAPYEYPQYTDWYFV